MHGLQILVASGHSWGRSSISLSSLRFLKPYAVGAQFIDYRLPNVTRARKQTAMGRPVDSLNEN
jgi:hypothetical protein